MAGPARRPVVGLRAGLRAGLSALAWNPIVAKELRSRMRSWRAPAVLVGYLAVVGIIGYTAYDLTVGSGPADVRTIGQVGMVVFIVLAASVLAVMALLVPGLVGGVVSGERDRQTLDLLLCTRVRPARIVVGKLVAALAFVVLLLAASVPLFGAALLLGGITLAQVLVMLLVALVTVAVLGAAALLCSVVLRRTTTSTIAAYLAAFALIVVPVLVGTVANVATTGTVSGRPLPSPSATFSSTATGQQARSGAPLIDLFSPAAAAEQTLRADTGAASACGLLAGPCFAAAGPYGVPGAVRSSDQRANVALSGWKDWQVFVLLDGLLTIALVAASAA
ncbi:MAG: ABC transporter permease, partial [Acidimicrobiales bacterium]